MMMVLRGTISFKKDPTHKEQGRRKKEIFTQPKKEEVVLLSVVVVSKY